MLYWLLKRILLGPILRVLFTPRVEGLDHVPTDGPAILASNHLSFSDSFFLPLVVERRITFLAKSDYFTGRGLKGRLTAAFFRGVGQVPVDRAGGSASSSALTTGLRILRSGDLLGIYPEGTRSPDGRLYRGRTGVARMALEGKVAVIPVAMIDTDKAQPTGTLIPKVRPIGVRFGPPLDFSRYEGMHEDRFVLRSITDEIMYALMELSGQEYVDIYAGTQKQRLLAAAKAKAKDIEAKAKDLESRAKEIEVHLPDFHLPELRLPEVRLPEVRLPGRGKDEATETPDAGPVAEQPAGEAPAPGEGLGEQQGPPAEDPQARETPDVLRRAS